MKNTFHNLPVLSLSTFVIPVIFFMYFGFGDDNPLRVVIYLIPIILIVEKIVKKDVRIQIYSFYLCIFLLLFLTLLALLGQQTNVKEGIFIFLSVSMLALNFTLSKWFPYLIVFSSFALIWVHGGFVNINSFQVLTASALIAETSFALIVPLVSLYSLRHGKWFLLLLSIISLIFTIKRISVAALILAIILDLMRYGSWRYFVMPHTANAIKFALFFICFLIGFNSVWFYEELAAFLTAVTGSFVSANALSAGRHFAMVIFENHLYEQNTSWSLLFGNGVGYSTYIIQIEESELSDKNFNLLHNDFVRAFADYGLIGLTTMVVLFVSLLRGTRLMAAFGVYTIVVFVTDNVMTYYSYWVVFVCLLKLDTAQMPDYAGSLNGKLSNDRSLWRRLKV